MFIESSRQMGSTTPEERDVPLHRTKHGVPTVLSIVFATASYKHFAALRLWFVVMILLTMLFAEMSAPVLAQTSASPSQTPIASPTRDLSRYLDQTNGLTADDAV